MEIKVVNKSAFELPAYATILSAGLDMKANIEKEIVIKPLERVLVPTGIFIELPDGYEAQIRPRSGLASKFGITVSNAPGTIDPDYRGEVKISIVNISEDDFVLKSGERVAQMVIAKFERITWKEVNELSETERGDGGFGHTGTK
ncbi:MAG: dUTP diphosphatase [Prevotellaceae bacterium]|jgi:dUTP pyrophosphatase|nr:dUTP diphosphatase [Prevotellaceae bacterium]